MDIMNTLKAIIILQTDGRRTLAQYYDSNLNNSKQFERRLFAKTKTPKSKDEILVLDGVLVVHRFITDSHIYVVGGKNENPLVLDSVLNCLVEVIVNLSSNNTNSNTVLNNMTRIILALDEICDGGLILETNPDLVLQRITATNEESGESIAQRSLKRLIGL